ncbi:MAG TPA: hypothetical protein VF622_03640 [Segetibacter sp.]|jgi:hypothetical protein
MKKGLYISLSILALAVNFTSCKRVVDKIFTGVDFKVPDLLIPVPIVPVVPPMELQLGTYTQKLNLDSAIRANTAGAFGVGVVSSIKIKSISVTISNGDDNNNLSNFESARVTLSSNSQASATNLINFSFPNVNSNTLTVTPTDSPELLPYLKGGELTYQVFGKARKTTSKQLNMVVSVVVRGK